METRMSFYHYLVETLVATIARKLRTHEITLHDATAAISTLQHRLRGYDATQLASALAVQTALTASGVSDLVCIAADAELNTVAQTEQLVVQNPHDHP
jgi:hypothetical protein